MWETIWTPKIRGAGASQSASNRLKSVPSVFGSGKVGGLPLSSTSAAPTAHPLDIAVVTDVEPQTAYAAVLNDPASVLLDVRSAAEWSFVGQPALPGRIVSVEWQQYPGMRANTAFLEEVKAALSDAAKHPGASTAALPKLYVLCRSGARSLAAARALAQAGIAQTFNIAGGFEGDKDPSGRRGALNGWKAAGLPWSQS